MVSACVGSAEANPLARNCEEGTTLPTVPSWVAESNEEGSQFGFSVASAGDVNGDGFSDVIVGAFLQSSLAGRAFVFHGSVRGLSTVPNWSAEGGQINANFGESVASAGDVNGDGYDDVIVGADGYSNGQTSEGRAFVFHGSRAGLSSTPNWIAEGNQAVALFGSSVAGAGDVNGDGYSDVVIGAPYFDNGQTNEGRAFVYHGSPSGLSTFPNWIVESDQTQARLWGGATAGDVNDDGYADVIIGAGFFHNGQPDEGAAFVYHGSRAGLSPTPVWIVEGGSVEVTIFGLCAAAGDVNGDGYGDVIIGAQGGAEPLTSEGHAFVYHGSIDGLLSTPSWIAECDQQDALFGSTVATAGDINCDGFSDVIVGAQYYENGQIHEGRAFVYFGSATGLHRIFNWRGESDLIGADFGSSVACAGDVNGDGYSDVVVGARMFTNGELAEGRAYVYHGGAPSNPCPADISDGNGVVDIDDLLVIINNWGWTFSAGDITGNGNVDIDDLLIVINAWGPCI